MGLQLEIALARPATRWWKRAIAEAQSNTVEMRIVEQTQSRLRIQLDANGSRL
jgi:hypothetical protein